MSLLGNGLGNLGSVENVSELLKEITLPQLNKNCGITWNSANIKGNDATEVCNVKAQWTENALELKFCSQTSWKITMNVTTTFKTISYKCSVILRKGVGNSKFQLLNQLTDFHGTKYTSILCHWRTLKHNSCKRTT